MVEEKMKEILAKWNAFLKGDEQEPPYISKDVILPLRERFNKLLEEYVENKNKKALKECSAILKNWVNKRETIKKLLSKSPGEEVIEAVAKGYLEEEVEGDVELSELLKELGVKNYYSEGKLKPNGRFETLLVENQIVFVDEETKGKLLSLEKEEVEITTKIQVLNAKRQIMELDEKQMEEYEELQKRYVSLSKEKANLLSRILPQAR